MHALFHRPKQCATTRTNSHLVQADSELHVGYSFCNVVPHAEIARLLQSESAAADKKAKLKEETRRTFHLPMFWLNAAAL